MVANAVGLAGECHLAACNLALDHLWLVVHQLHVANAGIIAGECLTAACNLARDLQWLYVHVQFVAPAE